MRAAHATRFARLVQMGVPSIYYEQSEQQGSGTRKRDRFLCEAEGVVIIRIFCRQSLGLA